MKEQLSVVSGQSSEAEEEIQNPKSKIQNGKIYIEHDGLRVPFREIALSPSKAMDGTIEENAPVRVYDTSGPWTDPDQDLDVRDGLPAHRRDWIVARGDVEEYEGRGEIATRGGGEGENGRKGERETGTRNPRSAIRNPQFYRRPFRARPGACVTQMHYARKGIITPEMEFVAIRENPDGGSPSRS